MVKLKPASCTWRARSTHRLRLRPYRATVHPRNSTTLIYDAHDDNTADVPLSDYGTLMVALSKFADDKVVRNATQGTITLTLL